MIWFSCKQCGKIHGRPENVAGATIFCECSAGLLVPWESTCPEPPALPMEAAGPPLLPVEPVTLDETPVAPATGSPRARKRPRLGRRDPRYCFNHEDTLRHTACGDCSEGFCESCVVAFEGVTLCGPCKNYRIKNLQRLLPAPGLAVLSALIAFVAAPLSVALLLIRHTGSPWWSLVAVLPQALAASLAVLALREAAREPKTGGLPLTLSALFCAGVTTAVICLLTVYVPPLWT
jgi:hypothetical protein